MSATKIQLLTLAENLRMKAARIETMFAESANECEVAASKIVSEAIQTDAEEIESLANDPSSPIRAGSGRRAERKT